MSRGKLCKDWVGFPIFTNTPLIPKISRNTLVSGEQERVLFPAPLPRGERRRRQKEFVVFRKFDETTNYAN